MTCETPQFFLNRAGRRLFGIVHSPAPGEAQPAFAVVYCAPLFEEKLWSHRVAVNFARFLTTRRVPVLRFDYFGDGESEGLFEQASVRSRVEDITDAVAFLRSQSDAPAIFLVGLGYGATLAVRAAAESSTIAGVAAWQPIMNGEQYMQDILRAHLSAQMVVHRKVVHDRAALIAQIESGQTVNVEGYEIGRALYTETLETDLAALLHRMRTPTLVQQISPMAAIERAYAEVAKLQQPNVQFQQVRELKFWMQQKSIFPPCEELFVRTLDWLSSHAPAR